MWNAISTSLLAVSLTIFQPLVNATAQSSGMIGHAVIFSGLSLLSNDAARIISYEVQWYNVERLFINDNFTIIVNKYVKSVLKKVKFVG